LRAAQRAQPEIPEVRVGRRDHCERVTRRAVGQTDAACFGERAVEQRLDARDPGRRQRERSVRAGTAHGAAGLRGVADERLRVGTALRAARQMREVSRQPEQLELEGEGERGERRPRLERSGNVEEGRKSRQRRRSTMSAYTSLTDHHTPAAGWYTQPPIALPV